MPYTYLRVGWLTTAMCVWWIKCTKQQNRYHALNNFQHKCFFQGHGRRGHGATATLKLPTYWPRGPGIVVQDILYFGAAYPTCNPRTNEFTLSRGGRPLPMPVQCTIMSFEGFAKGEYINKVYDVRYQVFSNSQY